MTCIHVIRGRDRARSRFASPPPPGRDFGALHISHSFRTPPPQQLRRSSCLLSAGLEQLPRRSRGSWVTSSSGGTRRLTQLHRNLSRACVSSPGQLRNRQHIVGARRCGGGARSPGRSPWRSGARARASACPRIAAWWRATARSHPVFQPDAQTAKQIRRPRLTAHRADSLPRARARGVE